MHCQAGLTETDQVLHGRYDRIDLPPVRPVVTRVECYAGHCPCCGGITVAPVPEGMEQGSPFSTNIMALALYLRTTHAISYQRLTRLFQHLFGLQISEGALDAMFRRAKPCFDNEVATILARLRRSRIVCSDETSVRIGGRTHWNWVFQNDQVVIHVIRNSRAASVVTEVMAGHRPSIWVCCVLATCGRRIFTERLAATAGRPFARRTARLEGIVHHLGLALGGRPGQSFARRLLLPVSKDTLLRVVRGRSAPSATAPLVVGIDDWAFNRGHRYGTIICDLVTRQSG